MSGQNVTTWQITQLALAAAFLSIVLELALLEPAGGGQLRFAWRDEPLPELCPSRARTGRPCPSCGLTRGMVDALAGRFDAARAHHRAALPLLALVIAQVLGRGLLSILALRGPRLLAIGALDFLAHAALVAVLLFGTALA